MIVCPAVRGLPQCLIIKRLILVDLFFKGYIFPGVIAIFIKQQQGKQPRHSSVSVPEGMNAEEVQNDAGDQQKLIDIGVITGVHIGEFQLFHGLCCLISRCGAEAHFPVSVGVHFQNDIIVCFVLPRHTHSRQWPSAFHAALKYHAAGNPCERDRCGLHSVHPYIPRSRPHCDLRARCFD